MSNLAEIQRKFFTRLSERVLMQEYITINGTRDYSGKILNLTIKGVSGETLVLMMDAEGVCISAGSACRSREVEPSRVLLAMGLTEEQARNSIRVSFSRYNTVEGSR